MFCYFHIPFCRQRCSYCKFALTPFVKDVQIRQYLAYLKAEIQNFCENLPSNILMETLYFGGGTPSVLSPAQFGGIFDLIKPRLEKTVECTVEANPEDITREWVEGMMQLGVNRISLGVQSLRDKTLAEIGRGPSAGIFEALNILQASGISSVNIDWILGLPHVRYGDTFHDIQVIFSKFSCIKHMSVYFLEKGEYPKQWASMSMRDGEQNAEYARIRAYLLQRGWNHYELSNFCAPGYECKHNQAYWNHSFVRGFGLSAASYIPSSMISRMPGVDISPGFTNDRSAGGDEQIQGLRFENSATFSGYYRGEKLHQEYISKTSYELETGMFGLRTFSLPVTYVLPGLLATKKRIKLQEYIDAGLLEYIDGEHSGSIRPTVEGIFIMDSLLQELL